MHTVSQDKQFLQAQTEPTLRKSSNKTFSSQCKSATTSENSARKVVRMSAKPLQADEKRTPLSTADVRTMWNETTTLEVMADYQSEIPPCPPDTEKWEDIDLTP